MNFNCLQTYHKSQKNGTILFITQQQVAPERLKQLESGAGELYLSSISRSHSVEQVMQVALQLGDVYKIRFKIDYSGSSRGYAYLQYIAEAHLERTIKSLKNLLRQAHLKVDVRESKNIRKLLLKGVNHLTPIEVYKQLRLINHYAKLATIEYKPRHYAYIISYCNSDEAGEAYDTFRSKLLNFGAHAALEWFDKGYKKRSDLVFDCCQRVQRGEGNVKEQLATLAEAKCCCFSI